MRHTLLILPALLLLVACENNPGETVREAPRDPYLQFEYQVTRSDAVDWRRLNQQLIEGDITIEEAELAGDSWCEYAVQMEPGPGQSGGDLPTLEQTLAPYLSAFGHPRSMQFSFLITAFQARNTAPPCGSLRTTLQGLDLAGAESAASGAWRTGDSAVAAARPELGEDWLGPALEYTSKADGDPLYLEHAVHSVSPGGFVEGEFRFMLVSRDGANVVLARNGRFGMYNTQ